MFLALKAMADGVRPDEKMLVPLMIWHSAIRPNIESMNTINRYFFRIKEKRVLINYMMLNRKGTFFGKYPKGPETDNDKLQFYWDTVKLYYDWTDREFDLAKGSWLLQTATKEFFAKKYGFDNKQRKLLELEEMTIKKEKMKEIKKTEAGLGAWFK